MPLGEARLGRIGLDGSRFGPAGEHSPAGRNSGIEQKSGRSEKGNK